MEDKLFVEFQSTVKTFQDAVDRHDNEIKSYGSASQEVKNLVDALNTRLSELDNELKSKHAEAEMVKSRVDAMEVASKRVAPAESSTDGRGTPAYKSFFDWLKQGKNGMDLDSRKSLVEDTTGQILVPEIIESEIVRALPKLTIMRDICVTRPIKGDRIRQRSINEVTVGWGKIETTSPTVTLANKESSLLPLWGGYQYVEDLYGLTKIGEDELMDSEVNLEALLTDSFTRAIAATEDTAFVIGTGHGNGQPDGVTAAYGTTGIVRVNTATSATVKVDDMLTLIYALDVRYRKGAKFFMASSTELALRKLKDGQGQYLWQPSVQLGTPNSFLGYAILNQDDIPAIASNVDVMVFGDFKSGYRILDRSGMTLQRLTELYAESGLVGFKIHRRVGGGVLLPGALRILHALT